MMKMALVAFSGPVTSGGRGQQVSKMEGMKGAERTAFHGVAAIFQIDIFALFLVIFCDDRWYIAASLREPRNQHVLISQDRLIYLAASFAFHCESVVI